MSDFFGRYTGFDVIRHFACNVRPYLRHRQRRHNIHAIRSYRFTFFMQFGVIGGRRIRQVFIRARFDHWKFQPLGRGRMGIFDNIRRAVIVARFFFRFDRFVTQVANGSAIRRHEARTIDLVRPLGGYF